MDGGRILLLNFCRPNLSVIVVSPSGLGLVLTLCALLLAGCSHRSNTTAEIDNPAPAFDVELTTGQRINLDSLRGAPFVLNFWATTCGPCRRELPMLDEAALEHADDGLTVIAVNVGEPLGVIDDFVQELSIGLPVALDARGQMVASYEVVVLPMTFFVDSDGILRYRALGQPRPKQLEHGLEQILGSSG